MILFVLADLLIRYVASIARAVAGYAGGLMVEYHKSAPGTPEPVAGLRGGCTRESVGTVHGIRVA